jgi:hypothetical protein
VQPVARRAQDALGGGEVLALEIAVEGVGEEHHVAPVAATSSGFANAPFSFQALPQTGRLRRAEKPATRCESQAMPGSRSRRLASPRIRLADGGVARQIRDEALLQRQPVRAW